MARGRLLEWIVEADLAAQGISGGGDAEMGTGLNGEATPTKKELATRCERICSLKEAICDVSERICGLAVSARA